MAGHIEPTRITLARRLAGKTKARLAKEVGVTPATVNLWEDGLRDASAKLELIRAALGQPAEFFLGGEVPTTSHQVVSFRKRYDATRQVRDKAAAAVDMAAGVLQPAIKGYFRRFPYPDVPNLAGMKPEAAADALRRHWGLTDDPIRDVVEQLEAKGVGVFWITDGAPSLSAFCKWIDGDPYIILNTAKGDGCRSRFDACHELGHLCLHRDVDFETTDPKIIEREADNFSSAFLLPRNTFLNDAPRVYDVNRLLALKRVWKVSAQAMVRRLKDVGVFSDWQYEHAFRDMSAKGWRSGPEPLAGLMEGSKVHLRLCEKLEERDITPRGFAQSLNLEWETVSSMMPTIRERQMSFRIDTILNDEGPLSIKFQPGPALPYDD